MRFNLLLSLTLFSTVAFSQTFKLKSNNPEPRVGHEFEISTSFEDSITGVDFSNTIKFQKVVREAGLTIIGPVTITIDGITFSSDTLTLPIIEDLPKEKQGLWIRQINYMGTSYLIFEQRAMNEWKQESNKIIYNNEGIEFAELNLESLDGEKIKIWRSSSSSKSQIVDKDDILGSGTVSYKITTYIYEKLDGFEPFELKKKHFIKLPNYYKLSNLELN